MYYLHYNIYTRIRTMRGTRNNEPLSNSSRNSDCELAPLANPTLPLKRCKRTSNSMQKGRIKTLWGQAQNLRNSPSNSTSGQKLWPACCEYEYGPQRPFDNCAGDRTRPALNKQPASRSYVPSGGLTANDGYGNLLPMKCGLRSKQRLPHRMVL